MNTLTEPQSLEYFENLARQTARQMLAEKDVSFGQMNDRDREAVIRRVGRELFVKQGGVLIKHYADCPAIDGKPVCTCGGRSA